MTCYLLTNFSFWLRKKVNQTKSHFTTIAGQSHFSSVYATMDTRMIIIYLACRPAPNLQPRAIIKGENHLCNHRKNFHITKYDDGTTNKEEEEERSRQFQKGSQCGKREGAQGCNGETP